MAKGDKSFAAKARKQARSKAETRHVRVISSAKDPGTGAVRFSDRMVAVPADADLDEYLKKVVAGEE